MPLLRMWVHCPRASNGLLPRRSNLVGYVRWDAQSDRFPPCQTVIPTALQVAIRIADQPGAISRRGSNRNDECCHISSIDSALIVAREITNVLQVNYCRGPSFVSVPAIYGSTKHMTLLVQIEAKLQDFIAV